jgi:hypothetical protein
MTLWRFVARNGTNLVELKARNRKVSLRLRAPSSASFTLDGRDPSAAEILELATDLQLYRDGALVYRGPIGASRDSISEDAHTVEFSSLDYRARLQRVRIDADVVLSGTTDRDLAWGLVETAQGRISGNMGITRGAHAGCTTARTEMIAAGQFVADVIERYARLDPGFDWTISPSLELLMWDQRGSMSGPILDFGGIVSGVERTYDPGAYANTMRANGATGVAAQIVTASDLTARVEGRWDGQVGYTELTTVDAVLAAAQGALNDAERAPSTYGVQMRPGRWGGLEHIDCGDLCTLRVRSGRLDVNEPLRVQDIDISISESGDEQVTLGVAPSSRSYAIRTQDFERRLHALERR